MSSLTGMIQRREWKEVLSTIRRKPSEASVEELHLHEACKYDPPKSVVEAIIRANGRFRTAVDENGELPIHTACFYGASAEVIGLLADCDIQSLSVRSRVGNRTPLEIAQTTEWEYNEANRRSVFQFMREKSFPSLFDDMTGLPKKKAFEEWAHVSPTGSGKCFAFMFFIDITGFKYLNDTGGQNVGDEAIKWYASSIEKECRSFETNWAAGKTAICLAVEVFRVGGDEFVVVVKSAANADSSRKFVWKAICNTLLRNLGSLKESAYHTFVRVGCSAGMVSTSEDAEEIRKEAENLQNELKEQLKTKRGTEPLLSEFHADWMSKVNSCHILLEWDPGLFRPECRQAVAQQMQNSIVVDQDATSQENVDQSIQGTSVQQEHKQNESSIIDVYFHFQPPPKIKDAYTVGFDTKHNSYVRSIKKKLIGKKKMYEQRWGILKSCQIVLSNGTVRTIENILPNNNVRAIIWCAEGVDVDTSRDYFGFMSSIDSAESPSILPDVMVIIMKYSPQRAAKELQRRGVRTVIWIRTDVYVQQPLAALANLFLPICDALLTPGKNLTASLQRTFTQIEFSPSLSDGDFGVEGDNNPQRAHHRQGENMRGLCAELIGCEPCTTNIDDLLSKNSFKDLEVQSLDLQLLARIRQKIYAAVSCQTQSHTKICLQVSTPNNDGDATGLLSRTRAIAWETCKHFTTNHSEILDGVFRVASILELSSIEIDSMDTLLLWVDLQKGESSDAWKIDSDSKRMLSELGDRCTQLLAIFTSDEKHFEVMDVMIDGMDLKDVHREEKLPEHLPGTDICASSMHSCISVIPTRRGSDQPLLDVALCDLEKFERAFRETVLSVPTRLDDREESSVHGSADTDFPPIVAVYRDDSDQSIKVRVCFSDIIFMMRLCSRILGGNATAEKLAKAIHPYVDIRFDRSAFAMIFEKMLLQLEKMTPHQREKMKMCEGERLVHIEARAGTGKTFLALNLSLDFLRKHEDKVLLYASSSRPLCFFFAKWLCERPMSSKERETLLKRLFLIYPDEHGRAEMVGVEYDQERRRLKPVERKIPLNKGGKVVVDEAHHVFDTKQTNMKLVASEINAIIAKNNFEVLILSDESQSSKSAIYPKALPTGRFSKVLRSFLSRKEKWYEVELTEVVRSSQRIVAGAMTYQLSNKKLTHCAHDMEGPPLITYIFDQEKHQEEEIQVYADKIVEAITDLLRERFQNFDLHDRLAILVPDDDFRHQLKGILEATLGQKYKLETALESSQSLNLGDTDLSPLSSEVERSIVLDTVSNFHGQERLIVLGVDLDRPIEERGDVGLVRSRIYQTITRAQMMFCLINRSVKGGWFEWLQNVERKDDGAEFSFEDFVKSCNDAAADVVKRYAAEDAASDVAVVAREDQTGPKYTPQLPDTETTRGLERTRDLTDGSEAEPKQENDSIRLGAERSDENDIIQNFSVWDTSKNDGIRGASSGFFLPMRKQVYTLRGHTDMVTCCAMFSDGTRVISGSDDKTLKVWDVESGVVIRTLEGHTKGVDCCAVFANDTRVISGSDDKTLKVWDVDSGEVIRTLKGHTGLVLCCAVFADGTRAISGGGDGTMALRGNSNNTLKVWDLVRAVELQTLKGHLFNVTCCALFADGKRAISGSADSTLKVWDLEKGREIRTLRGHTGSVFCCAVFPDGTRAISGSHDRTLMVWDLRSGEVIHFLVGHTHGVRCCAVFADGKRAISGSYDNTLKVWDLGSGMAIQTLRGHTLPVNCCAVFADGTRAISGSDDCTLKVWDLTLL